MPETIECELYAVNAYALHGHKGGLNDTVPVRLLSTGAWTLPETKSGKIRETRLIPGSDWDDPDVRSHTGMLVCWVKDTPEGASGTDAERLRALPCLVTGESYVDYLNNTLRPAGMRIDVLSGSFLKTPWED